MTSTLTIKFRGIEEAILNEIVGSGLFSTKSEAIRSALVKYAMDLNLFNRKRLWSAVAKTPSRKITAEKLMKELEKLEDEA